MIACLSSWPTLLQSSMMMMCTWWMPGRAHATRSVHMGAKAINASRLMRAAAPASCMPPSHRLLARPGCGLLARTAVPSG